MPLPTLRADAVGADQGELLPAVRLSRRGCRPRGTRAVPHCGHVGRWAGGWRSRLPPDSADASLTV